MAAQRLELDPNSYLDWEAGWLSPEASTELMQNLVTLLPWEQRSIVLFGKRVMQPRLIAWAGSLPYRYSGQTLPPRRVTEPLSSLLGLVSKCAQRRFNHVLINRYRHGRDSMGFHADDEPELGANPVLASLSLGAARRLVIKPRRGRQPKATELVLTHGGLLIMGGAFQHRYYHGVPKQPQVTGERLNLTFRQLLKPPPDTA